MGGSTADTPTTPESLRVSDADRDHAVDELRGEFVDGRLSHETFVYRMQTALDARNRGQLAGLFTDLPPRPARLLTRLRALLRADGRSSEAARIEVPPTGRRNPPDSGVRAAQHHGPGRVSGPFGRSGGPSASPATFSFPSGRGDRFTIGRTRDCDLYLTDLSVSRRHAELVRGPDGWLLNDLGSHNGTRVNGWLVRETSPVRPGDRLEFGSAVFIVADDPRGPVPSGPPGGAAAS
jgi:Inner membrane component of T3SS, cytoplasmic domain/Domain of unknown function (DUF1707)